jgi:hypothetical protein
MLRKRMTYKTPQQPENSFRVTLELQAPQPRLDIVLLDALKQQNENESLSSISKAHLKRLFTEKKVLIKGQNAKVKSPINSGITYIDILLQ